MNIGNLKKLLWVADVALAAVLILVVTKVFRASETSQQTGASGRSQAAASSTSPQALTEDQVKWISSSGAIVKPSTRQPAEAATETKPVEVAFEYKLIGTAIHPAGGYAFFEGAGGVQKVAGIGDKIGDAVVVAVEEDDAVLERGGQQFPVKREQRAMTSPASANVQLAAVAPTPASVLLSPKATSAQPQPGEAAASQNPTEAKEGENKEKEEEKPAEEAEDPDAFVMSDKQYKAYLENIGKYMNEVVVLSHYGADSNLDGLVLTKVPPESEAYKRGLRAGDIVKTIQDTPITDTATAVKVAWDIYKQQDYYIELGIVRNGEEQTLSYQIWPDEE